MTGATPLFLVLSTCLCCLAALTELNLLPATVLNDSGVGAGGSCGAQMYRNGDICCLNCQAGTYVKSPCTTAGTKGTCEECDFGTFTEHDNDLHQCVDCAKCGPDQDVSVPCTHTQNTKCRCKAGRFCDPDEACEVCRKCLSCKSDEELTRNCTPTTNAVCKKTHRRTHSTDVVIISSCLAVALVVAGVSIVVYKKRCRGNGCRTSKDAKGEEDLEYCSSSTTLINPQSQQKFPTLVPVKGEESLRSCFELFEALNVDLHRKFFLRLGLANNLIRSRDNCSYDDRMYELLCVWFEQTGSRASLNDLLAVLADLNQRSTAQRIMNEAVRSGHYLIVQSEALEI